MSEGRACPFCGARGELIERHNPLSKWRYSIDCTSTTCGASGPVESNRAAAWSAWDCRVADGATTTRPPLNTDEVPGTDTP